MLEGEAIVGESDMAEAMQHHAVRLAGEALDAYDVTEATDIAHFIKEKFDGSYGGGWQCVVGTDFGSFVSHRGGCYVFFCIGSLAVLLFSSGQLQRYRASKGQLVD